MLSEEKKIGIGAVEYLKNIVINLIKNSKNIYVTNLIIDVIYVVKMITNDDYRFII